MKCQILFSGKIRKKYFNMSSVENFSQSAKRMNFQEVVFYLTLYIVVKLQTFCHDLMRNLLT